MNYELTRLFVCLVLSVNLKMENHTTCELRGECTHVKRNWQSNSGLKKSKCKVTWGRNVKNILCEFI